jgi:lysyl-tRNA synthetase class 2
MKPEKKIPQSSNEEWAAIGAGEEWVPVLRKAGFNLVQNIATEKAQGLQQKIGDIVKKYKLDMQKPSVDEIQQWIDKASI